MEPCDTTQKRTALEVRDLLIQCFADSHQQDTSMSFQDNAGAYNYCCEIVKKFFDDSHADFNHPTKQSLIQVMDALADFSHHFRSDEVITKNYQKMSIIVNNLP